MRRGGLSTVSKISIKSSMWQIKSPKHYNGLNELRDDISLFTADYFHHIIMI